MSSRTPAQSSSTRRPVLLVSRRDLQCEQAQFQGQACWIVKDRVGLSYFRLQPAQFHVLELLDGRRSLEEIREGLLQEFPTLRPCFAEIQHLITDLHRKGLVHSNRRDQGAALLERDGQRRRREFLHAITNVLYIRLPGWDPETMLQEAYRGCRWAFRPVVLVLAAALVLSSWVLLLVQFDVFERSLPEFQQFFSWPNLLYVWITIGIAKLIHELAHGLTCRHFGGECHEIGVAFLVFSPCLYCDVSDSWVMPNKWKRMAVAAAGMTVELVISAVAIWSWWFTSAGLLHHLCLNVFLVTTITTILFNANPLLRFDGYYLLCDWLEIPNLRPKADRALLQNVARVFLGIEPEAEPFMPVANRNWFAAYSVAAALYRWFLLFSITLFLCRVLKPYGLESLGIGLAVFSAALIAFNLAAGLVKLISRRGVHSMKPRRAGFALVVTACLIGAAVTVPIPLRVSAPFVVEPVGVQHVYASSSGRLLAVHVQPGQRVKRGEVLLELEDFQKPDRLRRLQIARDVQSLEVRLQRLLGDADREQAAAVTLHAIETQLADYEQQVQALKIRARSDGRVIPPGKLRKPPAGREEIALGQWVGTPLDEANLGCHLQQGTHVLSIAPDRSYQAVLVVDQADRNDVGAGGRVDLKMEQLPDALYQGQIADVSAQYLQISPKPLSNKFGGRLPTTTDRQGRERLMGASYQAIVSIDEGHRLLRPGMRGIAKIWVAPRTASEWIHRYLRQTFHFRI